MPRVATPPPLDIFRDPDDRYGVTITTMHGAKGNVCLNADLIRRYSDLHLGELVRRLQPFASALDLRETLYYYSSCPDSEEAKEVAHEYERLTQEQKEFLGDEAKKDYLKCLGLKVEDEDNESGSSGSSSKRKPKTGYVYIAHADTGHYKIGFSENPEKRIDHFDTQMPVSVVRVCQFKCDACRDAEEKLHQWAQNRQVKGEWFDLHDDAIISLEAVGEYRDGHFRAENGDPIDDVLKADLQ